MFKVCFEKAYESVDWNFLDYVMLKMGFYDKWKGWKAKCLKSSTVSMLVNGSPTKEVIMERALRHGDPMLTFFIS